MYFYNTWPYKILRSAKSPTHRCANIPPVPDSIPTRIRGSVPIDKEIWNPLDCLLTMRLSRPHRLLAATIVLFSILFMQLAVSAYACPAPGPGHDSRPASPATTQSAETMPCHEIDMEQPTLCHASHQGDKQSLDKPATPSLAPFVAIGYGLPTSPGILTFQNFPSARAATLLTHATAPPIAIRHCCFRV